MFKIKITSKNIEKNYDGMIFYRANFYINTDKRELFIRISTWNLENYKKQWEEGLNKIKNNNNSCLITNITYHYDEEDNEDLYTLSMILLYKQDNNTIIVQHRYFLYEEYNRYIGNFLLTQENCYDFIPHYEQYYFRINSFYTINVHNLKNELSISLIENEYETIEDQTFKIGTLIIKGQPQKIYVFSQPSCDFDHEKQWKEAIERIKTHNSSCLITQISHCPNHLYMSWWILYKQDSTIKIYFDSYDTHEYKEQFEETLITEENCYDFIPPESSILEKHRIQEWIVALDDIVDFEKELQKSM